MIICLNHQYILQMVLNDFIQSIISRFAVSIMTWSALFFSKIIWKYKFHLWLLNYRVYRTSYCFSLPCFQHDFWFLKYYYNMGRFFYNLKFHTFYYRSNNPRLLYLSSSIINFYDQLHVNITYFSYRNW